MFSSWGGLEEHRFTVCSRCVDRAAKPGAAESEYGCNKTRAVGAGRNELDQAVWSIGQIKEETRLREIMETNLKK